MIIHYNKYEYSPSPTYFPSISHFAAMVQSEHHFEVADNFETTATELIFIVQMGFSY
jgi:hypothetical protein